MSTEKVPGVYLAWHRWLDAEAGPGATWKIGMTESLGDRIHDSSYVTCFPEGWQYRRTFETADAASARWLETAVLGVFAARRIDGRELVSGVSLDEIVTAVHAEAKTLGIAIVERADPVYDRVRGVVVATAAPATPAATPAETAAVVGGGLDDLFAELSLEAAAFVPPVQPPVTAAAAVAAAAAAAVAKISADSAPATEDTFSDDIEDAALAAEIEAEAGAGAGRVEYRAYQVEAAARCARELAADGRCILQMACRCGKTPVAYSVICGYTGAVLFLVPGLALARQTAAKITGYGFTGEILIVGSDARPVPLSGRPPALMTTDQGAIVSWLALHGRDTPTPALIISTYQSSPLVVDAAAVAKFRFSLTVFDECHRCCGGAAPRPFNAALLSERGDGHRLFMTATPAYEPAAVSMRDRAMFGGVAYRYYLRAGIEAGYVNDFRLRLVAGACSAGASDPAPLLARQILAALADMAQTAAHPKLLVFCQNIRHAVELAAGVSALAAAAPDAPAVIVAHSRMREGSPASALREFAAPGRAALLFNCRLFQEGVEIPALNGVFFAAPRHAPRDIIQSLCRPLNRMPGKPASAVYVPVTFEAPAALLSPALLGAAAGALETEPNLRRFATIVPFIDALLAEDPRLYEHLLDPSREYPVGVIGGALGYSSDAPIPPALERALVASFRRAARHGASAAGRPAERLLRIENVPWDRAVAEVRRIVETCGRYPKTTDAWRVGDAVVCLHRFYRAAADQYAAWKAGTADPHARGGLEPHQLRDLETLPGWLPYGVEGPYPWGECCRFLERWLEEHGGVPPPVEINKGGYVGIDATPMERLSGALTCINQQVYGKMVNGKLSAADRVPADRAADLDRICARFGLRWRKVRRPDGTIDPDQPTFIQEAYAAFKRRVDSHGVNDTEYIQRWFPGYPEKHARQEALCVIAAGTAPDRWRRGGVVASGTPRTRSKKT